MIRGISDSLHKNEKPCEPDNTLAAWMDHLFSTYRRTRQRWSSVGEEEEGDSSNYLCCDNLRTKGRLTSESNLTHVLELETEGGKGMFACLLVACTIKA